MSIATVTGPRKRRAAKHAAVFIKNDSLQQTERSGASGPRIPVLGRLNALLNTNLRSDADAMKLVKDGILVRDYKSFSARLRLPADFVAAETTMRRRVLQRRFNESESERILRVARILAQATELFGDEDKAIAWLNTPAQWLPDEAPIAPIALAAKESGARLIEARLTQTAYGFF